jgi:hypothetical protein
MFIDKSLEMCDDTAVNNGTSFALIGDAIDIRPVGVEDNTLADFSVGEPLYLVVQVTESLSGPTDYELRFYTHTLPTGVTGGTQLWTSEAVTTLNFVAGLTYIVPLPSDANAYKRYLGMGGARTGNAVSEGKINAFITKDVSNWTSTATRVPATDPAS